MRSRLPLVVGLAIMGMLLVPGAAGAQAATRDSVTGTLNDGFSRSTTTWSFDVSSGPSGESPSGTIQGDGVLLDFDLQVTCLQVTGNRAVIGGGQIAGGFTVQVYFVVVDEPGDVQDRILRRLFVNDPLTPATCAEFEAQTAGTAPPPANFGSIVVTDAQPFPTSKDQCKNGGWRDYGDLFKNQGACVSFVATGGKRK